MGELELLDREAPQGHPGQHHSWQEDVTTSPHHHPPPGKANQQQPPCYGGCTKLARTARRLGKKEKDEDEALSRSRSSWTTKDSVTAGGEDQLTPPQPINTTLTPPATAILDPR